MFCFASALLFVFFLKLLKLFQYSGIRSYFPSKTLSLLSNEAFIFCAFVCCFQAAGSAASAETTRLTAASPPISGTFDLLYEGHLVKDIPANVGAFELQQR